MVHGCISPHLPGRFDQGCYLFEFVGISEEVSEEACHFQYLAERHDHSEGSWRGHGIWTLAEEEVEGHCPVCERESVLQSCQLSMVGHLFQNSRYTIFIRDA